MLYIFQAFGQSPSYHVHVVSFGHARNLHRAMKSTNTRMTELKPLDFGIQVMRAVLH